MEEYLDQVNELLKTATPIGACCLGFSLVLYKECGSFPPLGTMREFVNCKTVREGEAILKDIRSYQRPYLERFGRQVDPGPPPSESIKRKP